MPIAEQNGLKSLLAIRNAKIAEIDRLSQACLEQESSNDLEARRNVEFLSVELDKNAVAIARAPASSLQDIVAKLTVASDPMASDEARQACIATSLDFIGSHNAN